MELRQYQQDALENLKNGSILCGGVGSGKSIVSLYYYICKVCAGSIKPFKEMRMPRDLYIITTAKKRDSLEWHKECSTVGIYPDIENAYRVNVIIDSWNNIKKYRKVFGAFFIFDEQRVVGSGMWVKSFLDISRKNQWILLSATPGDQWTDYIPVFVANGFYKNKTEFTNKHCIYSRFAKYPKIEKYMGELELRKHRNDILVQMPDDRLTERHRVNIKVEYNKALYNVVFKNRWDPYENIPINETGKWIYLLRRVVNSDLIRIQKVDEILRDKKKAIIFYNYNYELDILREYLDSIHYAYAEWNGQKHEEVPVGDEWCYLVQYSAGCEGWNCITTDTMIFYSQSYSYRMTAQAEGRIDRINTNYKDLYYYHIRSNAPIDNAIYMNLVNKKNFNESSFVKINNKVWEYMK